MKLLGGSGRRKSDRALERAVTLLVGLAVTLSLLASYISYRAIKSMNEQHQFALDIYHLGRELGHEHKAMPDSMQDQ